MPKLKLSPQGSPAKRPTALVRLHPLFPDGWSHVRVGALIDLHEGSRVLGQGHVLKVALKGRNSNRNVCC